MCSLSYIQPQFTLPISHLPAIWNTLRTVVSSAVEGKVNQRLKKPHKTLESPHSELLQIGSLTECINDTMKHLGFENMSPVLQKDVRNILLSSKFGFESFIPYQQQNISAATFFENRYGFPERMLQKQNVAPSCEIFSERNSWPFLSQVNSIRSSSSTLFQQRRGFKTKNSGRTPGMGQGKTSIFSDNEVFSGIKNVFERMSGTQSTKSPDKLKSLLSQSNVDASSSDEKKIAFAEGYLANHKEGTTGSPWVKRIVRFIWIGFMVWITLQILQAYTAMGGNVKINVLKSDRFEVNPEEITVTFNDVKGMDEAKQELKDIVEFLRDPEKFKAVGAKLPKGVLLVGPPGIGKSLLARAVAGESGVPFFHASGSEFDEIFVGTGAKRVRQLFEAAKMRAPCIIFIDEIDSVGAKRTSSQIHPYANQTINQLLSEMDGFQQNVGVIVLGASNRRDNLDKALLRPGRFDVEVRVYPPDFKGRKEILEHYLSKVKHASDLNVDKMARGTTGCTGADLENMVNQAALKAAVDGEHSVTMTHMEFARDKVLMGPAKKTKIPDEETNLVTSYHEAGHTLVAYYTKDATPLNKVTIIPRGQSLGHTSFVPDKDRYNHTRAQLLAEMDVCMGGRVAEEIIYGSENVTTGASADFSQATGIATAMVKQFGMSEKVGVRVFHDESVDTGLSFMKINEAGPSTTELVDNEIKRLLQESYERARTIIKSHQTEHRNLVQALMKHETLDVEEVKAIIEGKPMPPRNDKPLGKLPSLPPTPTTTVPI